MSKIKFPPIENVNQFRQQLLVSMTKLSDQSTIKTAQEEVTALMQEYTTNQDRMNVVVYHLTEFNDSMKSFQKKEIIKLLGKATEIFEDKLGHFLPKILAFFGKRIKDTEPSAHQILADTIGNIVHYVVGSAKDQETLQDQLGQVFKQMYVSLLQSNKVQQQCACLCLSKVIQNAPSENLRSSLPKIAQKMSEFCTNTAIKCKSQLFETIIALILAVEGDFKQHVDLFMPHFIAELDNADFNTRKVGIVVIYTISTTMPETLKYYKQNIADILGELRFDKIKSVRDLSLETLNSLKEVPDLSPEEQLKLQKKATKKENDEKNQKKNEEQKQQANTQNKQRRVIQNVEKEKEQKELDLEKANEQQQKQEQIEKKQVSIATQKRREAKTQPKKSQKRQKKEHQSIFQNKINKDFLQAFGEIDKGFEILIPDGEKIVVKEVEPPLDFGGFPLFTLNNEEDVKNNNPEDFPQLTTIGNADYYEDGTVLLTEEQKTHFHSRMNTEVNIKETIENLKHDQILENLEEEEQQETNQSRENSRDRGDRDYDGYYEQRQPINPYINNIDRTFQVDRGIAPPALNQHQQQSLNYIFFELEKISQQQARMMESMSNFQNYARNELGGLRQRVHQAEQRVQQCYIMRNMKYQNQTMAEQPFERASINYYNRPSYNNIYRQQPQPINHSLNVTMQGSPKAAQNPQQDWERIQSYLQQNRLSEAYSLAISNQSDLILIKLMGKTGICLDKLLRGDRGRSIVEYLIQRIITIMTTKEFVHVLLPWITELSDMLVEYKNESGNIDFIAQTIVSDLIEVLIGLINDVRSGIDAQQKNEIHRIYDNLSQAFKI